jgi:three-Cys-motif partner protein
MDMRRAVNGAGCSEFSRLKWRCLEALLDLHIQKVKGTIKWDRTCQRAYYYVDLYAGPGYYESREGAVGQVGSPVIALRRLKAAKIPYRLWLADPKEHEALQQSVICEGNPELMRSVLAYCCAQSVDSLLCFHHNRKMLGLVFIDPNGHPDWEHVGLLARGPQWNCMDFLININANIHKRCSKTDWNVEQLRPTEHLRALKRRNIYLWKPDDADPENPSNPHQFALAFCTNGRFESQCRELDFYHIDSPEGWELSQRIDYSEKEREENRVKQELKREQRRQKRRERKEAGQAAMAV